MSDPKIRKVLHVESGRVLVERARWCDSFASITRGFTFRRKLEEGQGLVLVYTSEGIINAGITMLFVFFDLGVIWVNGAGEVVDTVLARPWRPSYLPAAPAMTVVETTPAVLDYVRPGDHIEYRVIGERNLHGAGDESRRLL